MDPDFKNQEFDFTEGWKKELEQCEALAENPCAATWETLCRACEARKPAPKPRVLDKGQATRAARVYKSARALAKEYYARAQSHVDEDGVFQFTIHMQFPLELVCCGPVLKHFACAVIDADNFRILPLDSLRFDLEYFVQLYK